MSAPAPAPFTARLPIAAGGALCAFGLVAALTFFAPWAAAPKAMLCLGLLGFAFTSARRPFEALAVTMAIVPLLGNLAVHRAMGYFPAPAFVLLAFGAGWAFGRAGREAGGRPLSWLDVGIIAFTSIGFASFVMGQLRYSQLVPRWGGEVDPARIVNVLGETSRHGLAATFEAAVTWLAGPVVFWAARHATAEPRGRRLALTGLAAGVAGAVLFGVWQSLFAPGFGVPDHFRALGQINATFLDPNALGLYLSVSLAASIAFIWSGGGLARRFAAIALLMAAMQTLLASGSRTGLSALTLATILAVVSKVWRGGWRPHDVLPRRRSEAVAWALAALCLTAFAAWKAPAMAERVSQTAATVSERGLLGVFQKDRAELWRRAVLVTARHPIAGTGLGAYWTELPNEMDWRPWEPAPYRDNAANWYLQVSAELGVAGLILGLWTIGGLGWTAARRLWRPGPGTDAALAAGALVMLAAFVSGPHTQSPAVQAAFWFAGGVAAVGLGRPASRRIAGIAAGIALVFVIAHAWTAFGDLSYAARQRQFALTPHGGFHEAEPQADGKGLIWTTAEAWSMVPKAGDRVLMDLHAGHPDLESQPVTVQVLVDGSLAETLEFAAPGETKTVVVAVPETGGRYFEVRLRVSRTFRPSESIEGSADGRDLGVLLGNLRFEGEPRDPLFADYANTSW